ncbi:S24/S26 family peptidase [Plebeiibacterium sediminum]|uniref:S24/S26 family peptidase n=1 Tax=Plebeiibacterium sediminum TaxID=2992112 RepID=A0AAE3M2S7_9BACT|nr:S24/S26 family peptidase [Plebeiobacterium sediminum]MCW3785916.1 S24/S26 family peptidase [Plebeiobacterium sediminum]
MNSLGSKKDIISQVFIDLLQQGKDVDIPVYGLSMFPFYLPEDHVRVGKVNFDTLKPGDVVVFKSGNKLVAHRLLKIDRNRKFLICKGDGLIYKDKIIFNDDVVGVVCQHFRNSRVIKSYPLIRRVMVFITPFTGFLFFYTARIWNKMQS